jgi:hypothetical protein
MLADLGRVHPLDGEAAHCRHWSPGLSPQSVPAGAREPLPHAYARRRSAPPAAELSLPFLGQLVQEIGKGAEFKCYLLQGRAQALCQVFNSQGVEFEFLRLGLC